MPYLLTLLLLLLPFLYSCGKKEQEEVVEDAILSANIALSNFECDKAIAILETIGRQNTHAKYLQTLASAYACKSDFDAPTFFATDIAHTADLLTVIPLSLGGIAAYTTSESMDDPENTKFLNLQTAIDILLYAGNILSTQNPTVAERSIRFTAREAADINAQLLYMLLTQLGKYYFYYGDASTVGVKGAGGRTGNDCFISYQNLGTPAFLNAYIAGAGGACNGATLPGHLHLGSGGGNINIARACQGVILFNNILDLIPSVTASVSGDDLSSLSDFYDAINNVKGLLVAAVGGEAQSVKDAVSRIVDVQSQARCVADNPATDLGEDAVQYYFAYYFETLFQ